MGFALLKGWLKELVDLRVHVVEPDQSLRERALLAGATASSSADEIPSDFKPEAIVMAVKPRYVVTELTRYQTFLSEGALLLSVAAGVTLAAMERAVGPGSRIVRCMPNMPAAIGAGALVCCQNASSGDRVTVVARQLLSASGEVHFVADESLMDAVTAVSGSGPAYVFNFIESLIEAGSAAGLPEDLSRQLAIQTVYGAGLLAKNSEQSPSSLRQQVTSPNGTTAAALAVLMAPGGLARLMTDAVRAAKTRSIELGA